MLKACFRGEAGQNQLTMPKATTDLNERFRTALVTGASSGIGRAAAEGLLAEGIEVYGTSRNPEKLEEPGGIRWLRLEGATPDGAKAFIRENAELLARVDILINNAGSAHFGSLAESPEAAINQQLQLLLHTPILLTREVLCAMQGRRKGCIVNVSSLAASFPLPFMATYSAGKAGLSTFTQSLILSEKTAGVSLIDFRAGDFRTAFNERASRPGQLDQREQAAWEQLEKHLNESPGPDMAAGDMLAAIRKHRSRVVRSGGFFQTRIAPIGVRILPISCLLRAIRWYYKLPSN